MYPDVFASDRLHVKYQSVFSFDFSRKKSRVTILGKKMTEMQQLFPSRPLKVVLSRIPTMKLF